MTFHDPSESREQVEAVLKPLGWACTQAFWDRYHRDAWVFNLVNALTRTATELEDLRAQRVVAADPAPTGDSDA